MTFTGDRKYPPSFEACNIMELATVRRCPVYNARTLLKPCHLDTAMLLIGISQDTGRSLGLPLPMSMRGWRMLS
jgi:hypothetical protein